MNLPFYVRLESGLYLNLSQIIVIPPRQPNGSIRVQVAGSPLIVISPVTDEDEQNIRTAVAMLEEWLIQQLDLRNLSREDHMDVEAATEALAKASAAGEEPIPSTQAKKKLKKKPTKKRRRRVAA